jgi:hypothetical protein
MMQNNPKNKRFMAVVLALKLLQGTTGAGEFILM